VLSQTLQAFLRPEEVLDQLLRIGKQTIISIPNFGYWKVRLHLLFKGTMPITKNLPNEWYNTPNLHMCTIQDFVNFCNKKSIKIDKSMCLTNEKISEITKGNMQYKNISLNDQIFFIIFSFILIPLLISPPYFLSIMNSSESLFTVNIP